MDLFNTVSTMKSVMPESVTATAVKERPAESRRSESEKVRSEDFQNVLKKVDQEKSSSSQKKGAESPQFKEVEKNIETLEQKIQTLKQKATPEQKTELENLEKFLAKLKQVLAKMKNGETHNQPAVQKIDFLAMMSQILQEISQALDQKDGIQQMTKKLEALEAKLDAKQLKSADKDGEQLKLFQNENNNAVKGEPKEETVKIIDRRSALKSTAGEKQSPSLHKTETASNPNSLFKETLNQANATAHKEDSATQALQNLQARPTATQEIVSRQYTSFSSGVSRAHMQSMIQNVTGKAIVTLNDGKSEVRMRLNPPELGKMSLHFSLEDGKMMGKIVVSTQEAKMLWEQNMWDLQKSLQHSGIDVQGMEVNVGDDGSAQEQELFAKDGSRNVLIDGAALESVEREYQNLYDSTVNYIA